MPQVLFSVELLAAAESVGSATFSNFRSEEKEKFFKEWTRKMVHARMNEFLNSHVERQNMAAGKHKRGGVSLRDKLFTVTAKKALFT